MKHIICEDQAAHRFALIKLAPSFIEGDWVPVSPSTRWFSTREEALATLRTLFDQDEDVHFEDYRHRGATPSIASPHTEPGTR